jgi:hypothetical protein
LYEGEEPPVEREPLTITLAIEGEGTITHADGTTETVTVRDDAAFGLKVDADGEVQHANPELWDGDQFKG